MDVYSSTASLVSTNKQDKTLYSSKHSIAQNEVGKETKRRRRRAEEKGRYAGTMVVGFLNLATVISITIIGAVYISHLQEHVSRLQHRIEVLEGASCDQNKQEQTQTNGNRIEDEQYGVKQRVKRDVTTVSTTTASSDDDSPHDSPHHRSEHHGIASHNVALVFGDPKSIGNDPNEPTLPHHFKHSKRSSLKCSAGFKLMKNDLGDYWCKRSTTSDKGVESMMFTWYNHMYYYFKKASWMNRPKSIANFNLTHDGRVVVEKEGIYIVHASIHFTDVDAKDHPHYGVYKTDGLGNNQKLLSKCVVSLAEKQSDDGSGVYPCQAWQLAHLKKGEQVFMSIGGYSWFQVEKETFHLALIKLNDYALEEQ